MPNILIRNFGLVFILVLFGLPSFAEATRHAAPRVFPMNFKWCVATAAHQIEGYNDKSDWWEWEHQTPCRIKNCEKSNATTDHWNRLEEDTALLTDLNVRQYRFSIEWAKIEPEQGKIDWDVVRHYRREIALLKAASIEPMITLHHFTFPMWVRALGGWQWEGISKAFSDFAVFVYNEIAPGVRDWVTINEPLVHLAGGYALGLTPPGKPAALSSKKRGLSIGPDDGEKCAKGQQGFLNEPLTADDFKSLIAPMRGLLQAHAATYHALHRQARGHDSRIRVGLAHHMRAFDAKTAINPLDWVAVDVVDNLWNWMIPTAIQTGKLVYSVPTILNHRETIEGLRGTQDFFGINYYTRDKVALEFSNGVTIGVSLADDAITTDLCWEIFPEGLERIVMKTAFRFKKIPILITENGLADAKDQMRVEFLRSHLKALHNAIQRGAPVEGYCHWSLLDNFEWTEGFGPRFGLYEVDYSTFARKRRPSADVFSQIALTNQL